jgi:hypothetical protein
MSVVKAAYEVGTRKESYVLECKEPVVMAGRKTSLTGTTYQPVPHK